MFSYAPSNGISHGTKQSISMILAPKHWLKFVKRSVIVANWANTSPHFFWDNAPHFSVVKRARSRFSLWSQTTSLLPIKYWNRLNCCQSPILFLRPFQPLLFCFWWDPFVMSGHLLCSAEPLPGFQQTSASGTGLLVPWANESMTVPVMS